MDEKKQIKAAIKSVGKKHVDMLREAFGDKLAISWFGWEKTMLGGRTPLKAVVDGDVVRVREAINFLYDFSTLPEEEEDVEEDFSELEEEEAEVDE